MFRQIFAFEIQNKLRQPLIYVYFFAALIFATFTFGKGTLPAMEKEHFNAPQLIAFALAWGSIFLMLVTSSIMGMSIYQDIEYNTKDYYLTYPITKTGYFFGRFLGAFFCVILIGSGFILGIWLGAKLGPMLGWSDPKKYGPNYLSYYLHPFLTILLPNLFFTSALFFGLVALTRNVKVMYSGGLLLFLLYFLSSFFLGHTSNRTVINIADPFGFNGLRLQRAFATTAVRNSALIKIDGALLVNRVLWPAAGLIVLLFSYARFNFETFFAGKRDKHHADDDARPVERKALPKGGVSFKGKYNRTVLFSLTKMELLNIIRDNYFWIILSFGIIFLGIIFNLGNGNYNVPDLPRTVMLLEIFNDMFPLFIFFIIIFYTGETLHRDRVTRFSLINDALPTPNWVLNGSKLISLLVLGCFLALLPLPVGLFIQLIKGYTQLNFPMYLMQILVIILPRFLEMVIFAYLIHVLVNNKFAAHAAGISIWLATFFLLNYHKVDYRLILYSYTPSFRVSDMDGIGHMIKPVIWFDVYWLLFGGLLVIVSALFYYRGITSSFKERLQLAVQRFNKPTLFITAIMMLCFLITAGYLYYNVSYLNNYISSAEQEQRAATYELKLKRYADLPLPKITRMKLLMDIFPAEQREVTKAFLTIVNQTASPISTMLLDKDELTGYSVKINGKDVPFECPLIYPRGKFNWFRPKQDTSDFRLYHFAKTLQPGDSAQVEVNSFITYSGFSNDLYANKLVHNGTFIAAGLPGLGYDEGEELTGGFKRKEYNLPVKKEAAEVAQNDPEGMSTLSSGSAFNLFSFDITVSTAGDQTALAPGNLQGQWSLNGRNYYHYSMTQPGMYGPVFILSAKYKVIQSLVQTASGRANVKIYYNTLHKANINRFMSAYRDGLQYFSKVYGSYRFHDLCLAETGVYGPQTASMASLTSFGENFGWNAAFRSPDDIDYCYLIAAKQASLQWWRFQVAPNSTVGSLVISEGLSKYDALVLLANKYGENNMRRLLADEPSAYLFWHTHRDNTEHPLIKANKWYEWNNKAGQVLYELKDLIGDSNMNAALREFKNAYYLKSKPPFAGSNDLYQYLQKHTPDSLRYYLDDTWNKITFYDNRVINCTAKPTGKNNEYKVSLAVDVAKVYVDARGNDIPAPQMNDYIDIGVFAVESRNHDGRNQVNPLYLKRMKLTAGTHNFEIIVKGKPVSVGVDPYNKLIDRLPFDNIKQL